MEQKIKERIRFLKAVIDRLEHEKEQSSDVKEKIKYADELLIEHRVLYELLLLMIPEPPKI